jgi:hypothetical protein
VFAFEERWWLPAPPETVRNVLVDLERYPQWWPQILAVASLGPDDARVLCRSALPYTLDLVMHAVSRELPVLEVVLEGHLRGRVRWRLEAAPAPPADPAGHPTGRTSGHPSGHPTGRTTGHPTAGHPTAGHLTGAGGSGGTRLEMTQEVTVHGPVAPFAAALRPLARWNHRRMMAGGLAGLRRRLAQHAEHEQ